MSLGTSVLQTSINNALIILTIYTTTMIRLTQNLTAKRPPVEETAAFLRTLLENHGANYLEKLFGAKARNALLPLGGPEKVAIALSGNFLIYLFYSSLLVFLLYGVPLFLQGLSYI